MRVASLPEKLAMSTKLVSGVPSGPQPAPLENGTEKVVTALTPMLSITPTAGVALNSKTMSVA